MLINFLASDPSLNAIIHSAPLMPTRQLKKCKSQHRNNHNSVKFYAKEAPSLIALSLSPYTFISPLPTYSYFAARNEREERERRRKVYENCSSYARNYGSLASHSSPMQTVSNIDDDRNNDFDDDTTMTIFLFSLALVRSILLLLLMMLACRGR